MEDTNIKKDDGFVPIAKADAAQNERDEKDAKSKYSKKFVQKRGGRGSSNFVKPKDEFQTKLLDLARVTRVTGGGKRMSFRATVAAGDKKGRVGIGVDKGKDVSQAVDKATRRAKNNLITINIVGDTIAHPVEAKSGPAIILLKPQKKGRGLVAGGAVRTICDLVGIKNISSKILSRSKNKLNNARATMEALKKLKVKSL